MVITALRRGGVAQCRTLVLLLLSLVVASLSSGLYAQTGGRAEPASGCPKIAVPPTPGAFAWRAGKLLLEAKLTFFAAECLAEHHPAVGTTHENGTHSAAGASTSYTIVVTVDFEMPGDDQGKDLSQWSIPIEAVSAKGVALGEGRIYIWRGEGRYHRTTRIILSESEIQRVVKLTIGEPAGSKD